MISYIGTGTIKCAAFDEGYIPSNAINVIDDGTMATPISYSSEYLNGTSKVTLDNLPPIETFEIYCVSIGLTGAYLRYRNMILTRKTVSTVGKKPLEITMMTNIVTIGISHPSFLFLGCPYAPLHDMQVFVSANCSSTPVPVDMFYPSLIEIKAGLIINKLPIAYTGVDSSSGSDSSCSLNVTMLRNSTSNDEFHVLHVENRQIFDVQPSSIAIARPLLRSVKFSDYGDYVI